MEAKHLPVRCLASLFFFVFFLYFCARNLQILNYENPVYENKQRKNDIKVRLYRVCFFVVILH